MDIVLFHLFRNHSNELKVLAPHKLRDHDAVQITLTHQKEKINYAYQQKAKGREI